MGKLQKALLIILILLLLGFDIILAIHSYYCYTYSVAIGNILKSLIPLIISLIYYFITARHVEKLSINYTFLFISILSFIVIIICKILYYLLIINRLYEFLFLLYIPTILFLILAFLNGYLGKITHFWHLRLLFFVVLILQLYFSFDYILDVYFGLSYTNPDRYELVRNHCFSDEEFSYLPNKIPDDATDIKFYCEPRGSYDTTCSLYLVYYSPSIPNDNHRAYYHIVIPKKEEDFLK